MIENIDKSIERLKQTGRYAGILSILEKSDSPNWPFIFEILFADAFELHQLHLVYEFNATPDDEKTVDFFYNTQKGEKYLFELVSPEMSEELKAEWNKVINTDGITEFGVELSSNHQNIFFRPEAQTLRMQEKILGKVDKFPEPYGDQISVIVVNCSDFHFGHFDDEDARIVMHGMPNNPILLERWEGNRIIGLLEKAHKKRETSDFQRKITAVIFVQKLKVKDLLNEAWIVCNTNLTNQQRVAFKSAFSHLAPVREITWL